MQKHKTLDVMKYISIQYIKSILKAARKKPQVTQIKQPYQNSSGLLKADSESQNGMERCAADSNPPQTQTTILGKMTSYNTQGKLEFLW